ncbi:hypothetical protein R69927_06800 [Paraburkholderia domus]|uniref:Rieske domain-containing protein n=1 Tax=Paraburkholderia domus TaxID=2793075 RepID=A0A9N8MK38_9BURK|nr:Rieske (2Fe-2S) protein [Paraburkholderia domus]MBK5053621.1 Rieske (2Fe-2S) protein [Burkholderia sp. R-70006]MBK5064904.1 Rieske (2Fe-2S) protein [Burkholderia sp. R-70199]MBK5090891.1 Rieske (2Fe-2S) protein [Burkholderia sp. R-69927]MBK5125026.1 Rieske (2Fe-2S) protein [Burkholderia sp. R-69980]MBK5168532.1 Rieske (2Fe-2S) protein [Burkholderia sp. R-70211]MBK5183841.1 Rieske (2Fe-2S) protein [Burkholderia sp. R-69749]MCI0144326.1 Rieske 2Fe-2S domain-containing protein [Paraburkholde
MEKLGFERFDATAHWYPVAASNEIQAGLIVQAFLDGQELALWRSSDGELHAWENRCPHRGTRFTLGRIVGDTLICAYHGWKFAPQGQCLTIPANPTLTPPKSACAKTFSVREDQGMVWVTLGDVPWSPLDLGGAARSFCRGFVLYRAPEEVRVFLLNQVDQKYEDRGRAVLASGTDGAESTLLFLQPMASDRTVAYLWADTPPSADSRMQTLKRATSAFKTLRNQIELVAQ